MRQDFGEFGESITPVSPDAAAKMMMDFSDPDNRRRGTVLISNSPFGGTDVYVQWYRDSVATETDPLVKAASIAALGRFGRPEDAVVIALALDESQPSQVRWEAAKALQRLHNPAVVPVLCHRQLPHQPGKSRTPDCRRRRRKGNRRPDGGRQPARLCRAGNP